MKNIRDESKLDGNSCRYFTCERYYFHQFRHILRYFVVQNHHQGAIPTAELRRELQADDEMMGSGGWGWWVFASSKFTENEPLRG